MYKNSPILVIIPARAGSKGVSGKNLQKIGDRSLVEWALSVARNTSFVDRIIVSTDSKEIRSIVNKHGDYVPFLRPAELARDETPSLPVFQHALEWAEETDAKKYEYVVVLEPTCPFRLPIHIEESLKLAQSTKASSVMSLVEVIDHHPVRVKRLASDGKITPFSIPEPEGLRRQDQEPAHIRNGAVYIFRRQTLSENRLWGDSPYGFLMDHRYYSINIDEPLDLNTARAFYKHLNERGDLASIDVTSQEKTDREVSL